MKSEPINQNKKNQDRLFRFVKGAVLLSCFAGMVGALFYIIGDPNVKGIELMTCLYIYIFNTSVLFFTFAYSKPYHANNLIITEWLQLKKIELDLKRSQAEIKLNGLSNPTK